MKRAGKYWVPDHETLQTEALEAGGWQIDHLEAALVHVTNFDTAVDGGAHVGSWTMVMAERFARVIAFEPAPDTYAALEANMREWREDRCDLRTLVELRRFALGAEPGTAGMADDGKYHGGNTGGRYLHGAGEIKVETLDSRGLTSLGFLKLDLEGYELFALRGGRETILRCRPVVMLEDKPRMAHRYGLEPGAARVYCRDELGMSCLGKVGADWIFGWD